MKADNNMDEELLKFTSEVFKDYEVKADVAVWENISNRLEKRKKKAIVWWQYGVAASILMVSGLAFWVWNTGINENYPTYSSKNGFDIQVENALEIVETAKEEEKGVVSKGIDRSSPSARSQTLVAGENAKDFHSNLRAVEAAAVEPLAKETFIHKKKLTPRNAALEATSEITIVESTIPSDSVFMHTAAVDSVTKVATLDKSNHTESEEVIAHITQEQLDLGEPIEVEVSKSNGNNLFLAANMSSSSSAGGANEDASLALYSENTTTSTSIPSFDRQDAGFYGEREFELPLLASITFNYAISRKWSVESGLSYSLLRAKSTSNEAINSNWVRKEEIHYVGVPFVVNFILLKGKKLSAFSSVGIGIEKGILYRISENQTDGSMAFNSSEGTPGFKYNLNTGIGGEYRFIPLIGVYLQPGLTYFSSTQEQPFDLNGSKRSGLLPNLRLGLRFHLNK